jgi:hypothetical protein
VVSGVLTPSHPRVQLTVATAFRMPAAQDALLSEQLLLALGGALDGAEDGHLERSAHVPLVDAADVREDRGGGDRVVESAAGAAE